MIIFFTDRNLGKRFAERLRELGLSVEIHDDHLDQVAPDEEVLSYAAARGWVVITADYRIRYRPAEREAIISTKATVIHVKPRQARPLPEIAELFAANLSRIEQCLQKHQPPLFIAFRIKQNGKVSLDPKILSDG